jgi:hypothetical protein
MHMQTTNAVTPVEHILTAAEQSWLDACQPGEARSLEFNGRTVTIDRRVFQDRQVPTFGPFALPYKSSFPVGPDIALDPVGAFVQTSFRVASETLIAVA